MSARNVASSSLPLLPLRARGTLELEVVFIACHGNKTHFISDNLLHLYLTLMIHYFHSLTHKLIQSLCRLLSHSLTFLATQNYISFSST